MGEAVNGFRENLRLVKGEKGCYKKIGLNYSTFGSPLPGRSFSPNEFAYGYQGSEKDDEITNVTGANFTTYFREYDTRLGRTWSTDPITQPHQSPYTSMDNNPILYNDPMGDKIKWGSPIRWAKTHWKALWNKEYRKDLKALKDEYNEKDDNGNDLQQLNFKSSVDNGAIDPTLASYTLRSPGKDTPRGNMVYAGSQTSSSNDGSDLAGKKTKESPLSLVPKVVTTIEELSSALPPIQSRINVTPPVINPLIPRNNRPVRAAVPVNFNRQSTNFSNPNAAANNLNNLAQTLINNPRLSVNVFGNVNFATTAGMVGFNGANVPAITLMRARAMAVRTALINMGVPVVQVRAFPGRVLNNPNMTVNFVIIPPRPLEQPLFLTPRPVGTL